MKLTYRPVKALLKTDYSRIVSIRPSEVIKFKRITLHPSGLLEIMHGYAWDHASGAVDTLTIVEGALVHDALCELMHNHLLSKTYWNEAADIMYGINREKPNRMNVLRAKWIRRAIVIAGADVTQARKYITISA